MIQVFGLRPSIINSGQVFAFYIIDDSGRSLANVSIQAIIPEPPDRGGAWRTLFIGKTDEHGVYIERNLTSVRNVMNEWISYLGDDAASSYPHIVLILTYNSSNGLYIDQASIGLNPIEIQRGKSYSLTKTMHINRRPDAPSHPRIIKTSTISEVNKRGLIRDSSTLSYLPPSKPSEISPYHIWILMDSYIWPSSGYGRIPVAWIESSSSFGSLSAMIFTTSSVEFNIGYAVESSGTTFKAGATLWSTIKHFAQSYEFPEQGTTGYIYIKGKIEAARYQLVELDEYGNIIHYFDVYQDCVAIVDINSYGSEILGGLQDGLPPQINYIDDNFLYEYYEHNFGTGNIYGDYAYHILSDDFVDTYAASDTEWMDFAVAAGAILLWVSGGGPVAGIATGILGHLVASITSSLQVSYVTVDYDSYTNYDIYVYVRVGSVTYVMSNGQDGTIPLMGIKIIAYPQYPGGPSAH